MSVSALITSLRSQHEHGTFLLKNGDNLRNIVNREVPSKHGVYVVHAKRGRSSELVYIGKAGTLLQNGEAREQTLRKRMINRQAGMSRSAFFADRIVKEYIDHLHFEWFVTFEQDGSHVPPFLVEAQLLASYFSYHGQLPRWNKSA